jgi:hypothetical protein
MATNSLYKNIFKLKWGLMFKHSDLSIFSLVVFMFLLPACASKTEYVSYEDKVNKGPKVFNRDVGFCKSYSRENEKQIEGSKGAGERFQYKNSIFILCMKNKNWILKN